MGQSVLETSAAIDGDASASPLVLGLCNGPRSGGVIQLVKRKSYLGSGNLGAAGAARPNLAGVHCLILRGPRQTVVRRWSPAARLNGRPFDDAVLGIGDRLQLGGVELEVLPDASEGALAAWRLRLTDSRESNPAGSQHEQPSRETELARRAAGLERTELALQQQSDDCSRRTSELDRRQTLIDTLAAEICARESAVDRRSAANDQLRFELDAQAIGLAERCGQLDERQLALTVEQANFAELARLRIAEWEVQQAAEAAVLAARESAAAAAEDRLAQRDQQLAAREETESTHADLDRQRQALGLDRIQLDQARGELEASRQDLETQRQAADDDRRRQQELGEELTARAARLDQTEAECGREHERLELRRVQLEADLRALDEQHQAYETARQLATTANVGLIAAGDDQRQALDAELEGRQRDLVTLQQTIDDQRRQLEATLAKFSEERSEVAAREEQACALDRQLENKQQGLAAQDAELEQRRLEFECQLADQQQRQEQVSAQEQLLVTRIAELEIGANANASLRAELDTLRDELARNQQNFAAVCAAREDELAAAEARLETERQQLNEQRETVERQQLELTTERASLEEQLTELVTRSVTIEDRERLLAEQEASINPSLEDIAVELETARLESASPQSTEDVFRRLEAFSLLRHEPQDEATSECVAPPPAETFEAAESLADVQADGRSTSLAEPDDGDEEIAIERYMSQLLNRMRDTSGATDAPYKSSEQVAAYTPTKQSTAPVAAAAPLSAPSEIGVGATPSSESPVRAVGQRPATMPIDLSAMRELANQSARAAIDTHSRKMLLNDLYVKVIVCLTSVVAGTVLLSWAPRIGWIGLLAGAACFLGSIVWGVRLGLLFRDFVRTSDSADVANIDLVPAGKQAQSGNSEEFPPAPAAADADDERRPSPVAVQPEMPQPPTTQVELPAEQRECCEAAN